MGLDQSVERTKTPAARLFAIIWNELANVLGTAAAAAIVRRAAWYGASVSPELSGLVIARNDLEYSYALPDPWAKDGERGYAALRTFAAELGPLLLELTGTIVVGRLEQIPELRGLDFRTEEVS
jgi:hypothetical protein